MRNSLKLSTLLSFICVAIITNAWSFDGDQVPKKLTGRSIPSPIFGVTVDSIDRLPSIIESLDSLSRKPTTRIVFDEKASSKRYTKAVRAIGKVSYVMGELGDSYFFKNFTVERYLDRTREYLETLNSSVDIWEIGNEINGNWLGDTPSVVAKMTGSYDLVQEYGGRTALTLYHDQSTKEMLDWARTHVPKNMKRGLDYVFVSYYEDDQPGTQPDWATIFNQLAEIFPNSKLGFGEVGTRFRRLKESYVQRYYNMNIAHERYIGGYFWWYFKQDMVPRNKPLWRVLDQTLARN